MKIVIAGKALVVTSAIKVKDLKRAEAICPDALILRNENKDVVFSVGMSPKQFGIGAYGVIFDTETPDGLAQITVPLDKTLTKEELGDKYGMAFIRLAQVEEQFAAAYAEASNKLAAAVADVEGAE